MFYYYPVLFENGACSNRMLRTNKNKNLYFNVNSQGVNLVLGSKRDPRNPAFHKEREGRKRNAMEISAPIFPISRTVKRDSGEKALTLHI